MPSDVKKLTNIPIIARVYQGNNDFVAITDVSDIFSDSGLLTTNNLRVILN